jgi:acetyl esterase/lipase
MISTISCLLLAGLQGSAAPYTPILDIPYCQVDGKQLTLNAFLPAPTGRPAPAMVEIHGGWFMAGEPMASAPDFLKQRGIACFSITYRLGANGGFPECIRDCRNAIRFIRKNAARFSVDPSRIACMGGSAGGHLSLMVAMAPESFHDGGPTVGLAGVSAKVCGAFSWIPPADFVKFWNQGPDDVKIAADGSMSFLPVGDVSPNDSRPHLRMLFHGVAPDTREHRDLYTWMCPIGQVRSGLPPLLICDGERDPIVPGLEGKELYEAIRRKGDEATYWMTVGGGHDFPGGQGFESVLEQFINRVYR